MRSRRGGAVHFTEDKVLSESIQAADALGAATTASRVVVPTDVSSDQLLAIVQSTLEEAKAEEMVTIDLRGKTAIADYLVVCSGRSARQVVALAENLSDKLKSEFRIISRLEGKASGDWVLMDCGDIIVHVFRPEVREFYQLEKMWMQSDADPA